MRERLRKARTQLPYIPETFRLIWAASRKWTSAWAGLLVLQGLLPVALVYLAGALADEIESLIQAGAATDLTRLVVWVVLIAVVLMADRSLNSLLTWVRSVQAELVQDHIFGLIHQKAIELDLSFYDSPAYYDRLYRARVDAYDRPVALLENVGGLLQNLLTLIAMGVILVRYSWWIPLVLVAGMLPVLAVVTRFTLREFHWRKQNTKARRRVDYFDWLITDRGSAAELRLFSLGAIFREAYQNIRTRLRKERAGLARSQTTAELAAACLALLSAGMVMVWAAGRLFQGEFSLGDAVILYQAFSHGQRLMQTLLGSAGQILRNILFIENLFEFLATPCGQLENPELKGLPGELRSSLIFDQVSFRYPGSEVYALRNFSLEIPARQIAALVGENGAGKSTVIKLACRFYDPSEGQVLIDGVDLRKFDPLQLWRMITVLFQEPVRYHDSAAENIAYGDIFSQKPDEEIIAAARAAGAHDLIKELPNGYETLLGKWFGGTELSSGEWQRVALARAFLRQAPLMILDEPTSAMDSWAEADWMARFRKLAEGRTAILITHRFTTAMQADIIHVMDHGRILESGTHQQLMAMEGKYAQSWQRQMRLAELHGRDQVV